MSNKKNLIDLNVEKYDDVNQAVVAGEANGSFVRKVLKKIDKCDFVWTNTDKNNVSKNIGLISGSIPVILIGSIGSILNSALIKPLGRVIGFKGIRCKKRKDEDDDECGDEDEDLDNCSDEDEDLDNCSDECGNEDEDLDNCSDECDSDEDDSDECDSDEDDSDEVDSDEVDSDEDDSDEVDSGSSSGSGSNNEDDSDEEEDCKKKKKNWFGSVWDKIRNKKHNK
jgi:hypothetical protein